MRCSTKPRSARRTHEGVGPGPCPQPGGGPDVTAARHAHPATGDARWLTELGVGAGPCAANVELPAIPRLVGRSSVSMPATTPNSAHLRPTRGPDAAFMRPNQPTPLLGDPTRVARHRMAVPRRGPRPALLPPDRSAQRPSR